MADKEEQVTQYHYSSLKVPQSEFLTLTFIKANGRQKKCVTSIKLLNKIFWNEQNILVESKS